MINKIVHEVMNSLGCESIVVTAPTGVAAVNIIKWFDYTLTL